MATDTSRDLEAKLVVLGSSSVGKTSLLTRYIHNHFVPPSMASPTIGATFLTKRLLSRDTDPPTTIRLQIWDTAGQERFRSISKLYYRGANAALLCYDITNGATFEELHTWMDELTRSCAADCVIHVVGTKADVVAVDPRERQVPFERCIQYIAEHQRTERMGGGGAGDAARAPVDPRNSGFWGMDTAWDSCHEVSAKDGEGVEEVFRVIARKLVEQRNQQEQLRADLADAASNADIDERGRNDSVTASADGRGSFKLTDKGLGWLVNFPSAGAESSATGPPSRKGGKCC